MNQNNYGQVPTVKGVCLDRAGSVFEGKDLSAASAVQFAFAVVSDRMGLSKSSHSMPDGWLSSRKFQMSVTAILSATSEDLSAARQISLDRRQHQTPRDNRQNEQFY